MSDTSYTYEDVAQLCAHYGFLDMPLTTEYVHTLQDHGLDLQDVYGVCCDLECGVPFPEALKAAVRAKLYNDASPPAGVLCFAYDDDDWEAEIVHGLLNY